MENGDQPQKPTFLFHMASCQDCFYPLSLDTVTRSTRNEGEQALFLMFLAQPVIGNHAAAFPLKLSMHFLQAKEKQHTERSKMTQMELE